MKSKYCCAMIMAVIGLSACAVPENSEAGNQPDRMEETETLSSAGDTMGSDAATSADTGNIGEFSYETAVVPYVGEAFVKSVFAVGDDMLYLCGIKSDGAYFLGCMEEEQDVFQEFEIPVEDGMRVINMTVDRQGNCHILWTSVEQVTLNGQVFDSISYEKSLITVVNPDGELEQEIDVTDVFASGYTRTYCVAVDEAGNYYLENGNTLVEIRADGTLGNVVSCDGEIEGVGIGKSGTVYCVYYTGDGEITLAKLEESSVVSCGITLPYADALYSGVYSGADAELLLYSKSGGIYAYDGNALEERVPSTEMPVEEQNIAGYGAMADGRICILEEKNGEQTFYYIPTAKEQ